MRDELRPDQAVIGFCGGPFTVAGYLIEGKPTREFVKVKSMMYREPAIWHALMDKLAEAFVKYVAGKVRSGADVIQVFDSWVGALSPADYAEFVQPYSARILDSLDVPTIHFGTGTATLLGAMRDAGGDVIGLDWRIPLDRAGRRSGTTAASRGTSTRRCCSGRGNGWRARRSTCSSAPAAGRATSSTSATGCCPRRSCGSDAARGSGQGVVRPGRGMSSAVVLMAYGSPDRLADVPAYYADIRGGRPIIPERPRGARLERYRRLGIEDAEPAE